MRDVLKACKKVESDCEIYLQYSEPLENPCV